jgi:hypothetical protein
MASAPTLRESIKLHIEQAQAQIERVRQAMEQVGARSGLVETTRLNGDAGRYSRQQRSDRQKQQNEAEGSLAHPPKQPVHGDDPLRLSEAYHLGLWRLGRALTCVPSLGRRRTELASSTGAAVAPARSSKPVARGAGDRERSAASLATHRARAGPCRNPRDFPPTRRDHPRARSTAPARPSPDRRRGGCE